MQASLTTNWAIAIAIVLSLAYLLLMNAYRLGWKKLTTPTVNTRQPNTKITVVIAARNEAKYIAACLSSVLNQKYLSNLYEVILVNDHSTDNTLEIAQRFSQANFKTLNLPNHLAGKKAAINFAIQQASGSLIVTTDADCVVTGNWLSAIASYYEQQQPKMILAPVGYPKEIGILQQLQQFELLALMGITGATAKAGSPTMANGANLAYERQVYIELNGFEGINHIPSGDDVLWMHKLQQAYPNGVHFLKSTDAIVSTQYTKGLWNLIQQRVRWASKSTQFVNPSHKATMLFFYVYQCLILLSPFISIEATAILFAGKLLGELMLVQAVKKDLKTTVQLLLLPITQLAYLIISTLIVPVAILFPITWKGRTYNKQSNSVQPAFTKNQ